MTRPVVIGLVGGGLIVLAITLTFLVQPKFSMPLPFLSNNENTLVREKEKNLLKETNRIADKTEGKSRKKDPTKAKNIKMSLKLPSFDIVRVNPNGDAVIAGRAVPNALVTVSIGKRILGRVKADGRGEWVLVPDKPLASGTLQMVLMAKNPDGEEVAAGRDVVVVIDKNLSGTQAKKFNSKTPVLTVSVPKTGSGTQVIQGRDTKLGKFISNQNESSKKLKVIIETIDFNDIGIGTISGRSVPDTVLKIYLDNKFSAGGKSGSDGRWMIAMSMPLPQGEVLLRVDALDQKGGVFGRAEVKIVGQDKLMRLPDKSLIKVQRGNSLWRLARRVYGEGILYTIIYEANLKQIRDPNLIYPGQVFFVPPIGEFD